MSGFPSEGSPPSFSEDTFLSGNFISSAYRSSYFTQLQLLTPESPSRGSVWVFLFPELPLWPHLLTPSIFKQLRFPLITDSTWEGILIICSFSKVSVFNFLELIFYHVSSNMFAFASLLLGTSSAVLGSFKDMSCPSNLPACVTVSDLLSPSSSSVGRSTDRRGQ